MLPNQSSLSIAVYHISSKSSHLISIEHGGSLDHECIDPCTKEEWQIGNETSFVLEYLLNYSLTFHQRVHVSRLLLLDGDDQPYNVPLLYWKQNHKMLPQITCINDVSPIPQGCLLTPVWMLPSWLTVNKTIHLSQYRFNQFFHYTPFIAQWKMLTTMAHAINLTMRVGAEEGPVRSW